jgi:RNA:NAD 2'-phosphotransferase (TPT1/KptA family)
LIVRDCPKQRFRVETGLDGRLFIGATQGHSIEGIDPNLVPLRDAAQFPVVVHGTYYDSWGRIRIEGLKRMGRTHIHFASGLPSDDGVISGMRKSSEVLIYLNVEKCLRDGVSLLVSSNGVILSDGIHGNGVIPPEYFAKVVDRRNGQTLT